MKKFSIAIAILGIAVFLFLRFVIGFQHVGFHLRDLKDYLFASESTSGDPIQATIAVVDTVRVENQLVESPYDTLMWVNAIKNKEYIPEDVLEGLNRYKKKDFSKLVLAKDFPTDKEAEAAIVAYYQNEVVKLLQRESAHIQIGTCYIAKLQPTSYGDKEITRVTAMISAFNDKRGNIGNIQHPLDVIYDFVKYESDPTTWRLADFSQNIPYDYQLNKDPW